MEANLSLPGESLSSILLQLIPYHGMKGTLRAFIETGILTEMITDTSSLFQERISSVSALKCMLHGIIIAAAGSQLRRMCRRSR